MCSSVNFRLREQANDSMKRKELEANQALLDLKIRMERLTNQLTEIQEVRFRWAKN